MQNIAVEKEVAKTNLMNFCQKDMQAYFASIDEKPFRAKQVFKWIHQKGITSFEQMSDLSKALRQKLIEVAELYF